MSTTIDAKPPFNEKESYDDSKEAQVEVNEVGAADNVVAEGEYTQEQYDKLKRKIDMYLLPLMWLCYGIQQTDKTAVAQGTMANFGLRQNTGLVGQQYSWLTTIFYITYMCCEFPSNFLLQRWRMGKTLSIYMICWGIIVMCIGFANNFSQLAALRALQGIAECCISPGFILVIGSWYTTREHASRALVFQSANAGFGIVSDLILYGIGSVQNSRPEFQSWRAMAWFLGGLTVVVGILCLLVLGTPSEVPWLTPEEKRMANARIVANQSGHDRTGHSWKWYQVREAVTDPVFWLSGANAFLSSVPNGGLTTFGSIINSSFGFTPLQVIIYGIPRNVTSVLIFVVVGVVTMRRKNLRTIIMAMACIPPFISFLGLTLVPTTPHNRWTKWGLYYMSVPFVLGMFLAWTLIPSNIPGRTKRTVTSSFTFVMYCVGNMVGSQIFRSQDAPKYIPGITGACVCFGLEFLVICAWRATYIIRNRRRDREVANDGLTPEEREHLGKLNGEKDMTDFENRYDVPSTWNDTEDFTGTTHVMAWNCSAGILYLSVVTEVACNHR
ncbi:major facilitator superfamily domain-containing protein [Vararia minispora EC-137]|uniref:Major facilitator superfamily domain-containing protein n=1 Tax=Vararia minispora EC-137 TaxID=1314806 RepID=A0ACB8QFV8_9AGAM|nr:major facilitator superfamily domain-containing protein [Vararia minispora EC-137]